MILQLTCPDRDIEINIGDLVAPKDGYCFGKSWKEKPPYRVISFDENYGGNKCVVFRVDGKAEIFHPDNIILLGPSPQIIPPRPVFALCRKQISLGA